MSTINSKPHLKTRKSGWRVVLGRTAWSKHTYERPEGDGLTLLGSVSKGAQIGALAITAEGEYVQVVGDQFVPLKVKEIAKAVANAPKVSNPELPRPAPSRLAARKESAAPVVVVKKRRVPVLP
jgi:hypothetical protein